MSTFGIAAIQMDCPHADNLAAMAAEIERAKALFPWARMIVFSELSAFGADPKSAQPLPGPAEKVFCMLAKRHSLWLIPGSLFEKSGGKIFNTLSVIDPQGDVVLRYRKIYPWYPYEHWVSPGEAFKVFDVPKVGRFGVSLCYDMWFPETIRSLAFLGAEVIIHPTMTGTLDRTQELVVGRANAIMNQCYFLDVNGAGPLGLGQSQLIGPEGDVIHLAGQRQEIMPIRVNFERIREVRRSGTAGTVQVLKSFRDGAIRFPAYDRKAKSPSLAALGPMKIPLQ